MSLEHREIVIQNDDPSIDYVGQWTTVQANTVNDFGNFGPALSSTLHSTATISSLSFPFHGSSLNVFGSINIANASTNPNPTWQCTLDGISLGKPNIFQFPENNWSLCSSGNIPDGAHELVVNVTSDGMPFYLDYIEYRPSESVSRENSFILIENTDSAIDYISGWGALGGTANQTTDPKGLVNVTFVGTQLSWYGFIPTEESHNASSGEYSIDGNAFASFQLAGLPKSSATLFNQLFFITPTLDMGTHVLSAKYTGKSGQTPFTLDYLIVKNGSFPSSPSTPNSGGKKTGTHASGPIPTNNAARKSSNVGGIAGGVVGGIAGLAIVAFIIFFWVRRNRKRRRLIPVNTRRSILGVSPTDSNQQPLVSSLETGQYYPSAGATHVTYKSSRPSVFSTTTGLSEFPNTTSSSTPERISTSRALTPVPATALYPMNDANTHRSRSSETTTSSSFQGITSGRPLPTIPRLPPPPRKASAENSSSALAPTRVRQYEDSGIRLPQSVGEDVIEIPPTYSEQ